MYADYIEHQGGDENSIISAEHIDVLTFNCIDLKNFRKCRRESSAECIADLLLLKKKMPI